MNAKFEVKVAKDGEYYFHLLAANGQIILASEMYKAKASALNGIESVKKNASNDAHYERLTSKNGKHYFTLKAGNHEVIGQSQMYESAESRDHGMISVRENASKAEIIEIASA